jgi:hypothetical protein
MLENPQNQQKQDFDRPLKAIAFSASHELLTNWCELHAQSEAAVDLPCQKFNILSKEFRYVLL